MPVISVIVPVFNVENYIHRCVDSILSQTFVDFELILVDDGSPDNCGKICDEYAKQDTRIHVIHQANSGPSAARNAAIDWTFANSDSQWLSFIDSDDWVHPLYLELLCEANEKYSTLISQCKMHLTDGTIQVEKIERKMLCVTPEEQYSKWYSAFACGKLYNKICFSQTRFPVGIFYEDVTIWYKILFSLDRIAIVDEPLYNYYQREGGTTNSIWTPVKLAQINAWEDQLHFAYNRNSKQLLHAVLDRICWVYRHQCEEIESSNLISKLEKKKYHSHLLRRLRFILIRYRKELKEINLYYYYTAWAFPKLDRLHWIMWKRLRKR